MDTSKELPTVLSLCSGYGGIERGLDIAGVEHRVITYVEIEAYAIANLIAKMEAGLLVPAPVYSDITSFPAEIFRGKVSILTGGYPCQPFSQAGKRAKDDPRQLWPYIKEIIRAVRPVRCFFENVEGHITLGLREVIADLESLGYSTAWGIFSAREVGAPHQRKRVYILADSESGRLSRWAEDFKRERSENYIERSDQDVWSQSKRPSQTLADSNNGQRELKDQEIRARRDSAVDGGKYLADADGAGQQAQRDESRPQRQTPATCESSELADTDNARLEGWLQRGEPDPGRRKEQEIRCSAECSDRGSWDGHRAWPSEPGLGRVVDGCADRVDRIRLLGNGVVPATAAKAWRVLNG